MSRIFATVAVCSALAAAAAVAAAVAATPAQAAQSQAARTGGARLAAGSYELDGVHAICLVADGTWYGEDFHGWGGDWMVGSNGQTAIFGNYASGAGNDSMVVRKGVVQWSEWSDGLTSQAFLRGPFTALSGKCAPPAKSNPPGHLNPMD
jgi:hypothetical protein